MPLQLVAFAMHNGVNVDFWDLVYPIEAIYFSEGQPCIALSTSLYSNRAHFRTVFAEELGHHFTSSGDRIIKSNADYKDTIEISQQEHRAMAWAARHLISPEQIEKAFAHGLKYPWEFAEFFQVDEKLVKLRMVLYFEREKQRA